MKFIKLSFVLFPALFSGAFLSGDGLSILDRNPFIWPGFEASESTAPANSTPAASSADYEFHAVYEVSGRTHVLLKDRRKNAFHWVRIGEDLDGISPKSYDAQKDQILLAYEDQERWLSLQNLPEVSGGPVSAQPPRRTPTTTTRSRAITSRTRTSSSPSSVRRSVVRPRTQERVPPGSRPSGIPSRRPTPPSDPGTETPSGGPSAPPPVPQGGPPDTDVPKVPEGIQLPTRG